MAINGNKKTLSQRLVIPEIMKGYAVTLRQFVSKPSTMQYPEEKWDENLPDYYRGVPALGVETAEYGRRIVHAVAVIGRPCLQHGHPPPLAMLADIHGVCLPPYLLDPITGGS